MRLGAFHQFIEHTRSVFRLPEECRYCRAMTTHRFLSEDWITATRALREEFRSQINAPSIPSLRINLVVTKVPFGDEDVLAHLDSSSGEPEIELGHLGGPDATVTADYGTAKRVFVDGDLGAAMEGLQLGRIVVDGDMMKLMGLAGMNADAGSIALAKAVRAVTATE
jgi:hypothetical protein